jgi:uncharacterized damage-inducible protein DinB
LFDINQYAFRLNIDGIGHDESLLQPPGGGNCLNWVAGHMVATRNGILGLLGEEPIWDASAAEPYKRGSMPIVDDARARPFPSILEDFDRAQERIRSGLARLADEDLAAPRGDDTLGGTLHLLHFHEAYHIGQTAVLRRLAGKPGAIR